MKGLEDPDVQAYQEYMQDVALLLGADKDTVIDDIKETIKFEIELAKISLPRLILTKHLKESTLNVCCRQGGAEGCKQVVQPNASV